MTGFHPKQTLERGGPPAKLVAEKLDTAVSKNAQVYELPFRKWLPDTQLEPLQRVSERPRGQNRTNVAPMLDRSSCRVWRRLAL
jgi:hypothetical protein